MKKRIWMKVEFLMKFGIRFNYSVSDNRDIVEGKVGNVKRRVSQRNMD
jgi:hypothetical protein